MKIETQLFGSLEVNEEQVYTLPEGLLGFPGLQKFGVFALPEYPPFLGMQSMEDPNVSFVIVDPRVFVADYKPLLTDSDLEKIKLSSLKEALIYALVVLNSKPENITANLLGPVILNPVKKIGGQFVLANETDNYSLKHRLYSQVSPKAV